MGFATQMEEKGMKEEQRTDVLIENKIEDNIENGDEFETNKTMEIKAEVNGKEEATSDKENNTKEEIVDKREVEQENEEEESNITSLIDKAQEINNHPPRREYRCAACDDEFFQTLLFYHVEILTFATNV